MMPPLPRGLSPRRPPLVFSMMERRLAANLRRSPQELRELQGRALKSRLLDAFEHVPAYQRIGRSKALRKELQEDPWLALSRVPLTPRAALSANLEAYRRGQEHATCGAA